MAEDNVNAIISSCTILDKSMGLVGVFQLLQLMLHWRVHRMEANLRIKILLLRSACLHAGGNIFNPLLLFARGLDGLAVFATIFWIWVLVDCITKESAEGNDKIAWTLVILFAPLLGAVLYYFVRRPERIKVVGH